MPRASSRAGCARLNAYADDVPLLGDLRAPGVVGARIVKEETLTIRRTDRGLRSDGTPRRAPSSGRPGCFSPNATGASERIAPPRYSHRPPAHAAHTTFEKGVCLMGLASASSAVTGVRSVRESKRLCCLAFVPGTDDPSTLRGPTDEVVGEAGMPRSFLRQPQRPDGFYD